MRLIQRVLAMFLVMGFISICLTQQVRAGSTDGDNTLFVSLAEQGDASVQWILGFMYLNGEGMPQDYEQAVYWLTKAAEQGFAMAQFNLGFMYDNGEGVPQDYKQALDWYTKAAEQGLAEAQTNLGVMYAAGQTDQDYARAYSWFNLAASQGNEYGGKNRDLILRDMSSNQIEEGQKLSTELYEKIDNQAK